VKLRVCSRPCAISSTNRVLRRAWTDAPSGGEPAFPRSQKSSSLVGGVQGCGRVKKHKGSPFHASRGKLVAMNRTAVIYALASAALFGVSTPAAKALLGSVQPVVLAGLLYCGAGVGIALLRRLVPILTSPDAREQALSRSDWPWLAGAIAAGGIVGPLLLMAGLARACCFWSPEPRSCRGPARRLCKAS
jgi:hypothetical protein